MTIPTEFRALQNVPHLVSRIREQSGLNQNRFAKACGVSRSYISLLEKGRRLPSMAVLRRILTLDKKTAKRK